MTTMTTATDKDLCEWVACARPVFGVCDAPWRHAKATVNNVSIHYLHSPILDALCDAARPSAPRGATTFVSSPLARFFLSLSLSFSLLTSPFRTFFYFGNTQNDVKDKRDVRT